MKSRVFTVNLSEKQIEILDLLVEEGEAASRSELFRNAMREYLERHYHVVVDVPNKTVEFVKGFATGWVENKDLLKNIYYPGAGLKNIK